MSKVAKLVSFVITTRVIVEEDQTLENMEDEAIEKGINNILSDPEGYLTYDCTEKIEDDYECPYDPEIDGL